MCLDMLQLIQLKLHVAQVVVLEGFLMSDVEGTKVPLLLSSFKSYATNVEPDMFSH